MKSVYFAFIAFAALAVSLAAGYAFAADGPAAGPLSLEDCVGVALKNQSDVLTGRNSVISSRERAAQAKSDYYPQLSAERTASREESNYRTQVRNDSGSVTLSQNLYDGGLRENKVRGAGAAVAQSEQALRRTRQSVIYQVTRDYFELLRAMRLAGVQDARVKYLREQQDMVRTRAKLGDAAEVDSLPVEAQLANAIVDKLSAESSVETAAIQLQNDMGLSPSADFAIKDAGTPEKEILAQDVYLSLALKARPEVAQSAAAVDSAKASLKTSKTYLYPRPVVTAGASQSLVGGSQRAYSVTGAFVYDLFDGGSNRAAYREAAAGLSSAEIKAAQVDKDIRADVRQAYLKLINARERRAASGLSLEAAKKNYDVQESRYKQGLAIPLDLLNAQLQLVTAQSAEVQATYDFCEALAQVEYAAGVNGGPYEK